MAWPFHPWHGQHAVATVGERGPIDEDKARRLSSMPTSMASTTSIPPTAIMAASRRPLWARCLGNIHARAGIWPPRCPAHDALREWPARVPGIPGRPCGDDAGGYLEEQLEKCGVDYFDFYLLHNLCETSYDFYTDETSAWWNICWRRSGPAASATWAFPPTAGPRPSIDS